MKKIILVFSFFISFMTNAQVLGYSDFGVLLTNKNNQSSARSMALKGAFGALGGDLSATAINPASGAIFSDSNVSFTLSYDQLNLKTDFYGNTTDNLTSAFNLSQAGAILIFKNNETNDFNKVSISFNYQIVNNFKNDWMASGISLSTWISDPNDDNINYTNLENQTYKNFTSGKHEVANIAFAAELNKVLSLGFALNTYSVKFNEEGKRYEIANDGNGNTVDAYEDFWQKVESDGFSLSFGAIYKVTHNLRLGLSYTTPTWYEVHEQSNLFAEDDGDYVGYYNVLYSNDPPAYENNYNKTLAFDYNLRTPSVITSSIAFIFGKNGLISTDFSRKNYQGIHFNPNPDFINENEEIKNSLVDTYKIAIGTEWRIKQLSIRGGYSYEKSPFLNAIPTDNIVGFAFGLGLNYEKFSIDLTYDYNEQTDIYDFYPEFDNISPTNQTMNNSKIVTTVRFNL